jgi:hypothetical protein
MANSQIHLAATYMSVRHIPKDIYIFIAVPVKQTPCEFVEYMMLTSSNRRPAASESLLLGYLLADGKASRMHYCTEL